jgi:hypothetical protein
VFDEDEPYLHLPASGTDLATPVEAAAVYADLVARRRTGAPAWEDDEQDALDLVEALAGDLDCEEGEVDERLAARIAWAVSRTENQHIGFEVISYRDGGFEELISTLGDAEHYFVAAAARQRLAQVCGLPVPSEAADAERLRAALARHLGVGEDDVVVRYDDHIARAIADTVFPWKLRG